ncbi:MAG: hypothetical protein LBU20_01910 [Candidatus Nomurabacteria bacterium]|nr:hypothetical protein [Candidatus Nomurabacteria bacterium]
MMLVSAAKQIKRKLYKVKDRADQRRRLATAGARLGRFYILYSNCQNGV